MELVWIPHSIQIGNSDIESLVRADLIDIVAISKPIA